MKTLLILDLDPRTWTELVDVFCELNVSVRAAADLGEALKALALDLDILAFIVNVRSLPADDLGELLTAARTARPDLRIVLTRGSLPPGPLDVEPSATGSLH